MKHSSAWIGLACIPAMAVADEPLSAIDWLKEPAPITVAQPLIEPLAEQGSSQQEATPPFSDSQTGAVVPNVDVIPLDGPKPDAVGLLPSATTGLPKSIWQASSTDALVSRMARLPKTPLPALQALIYTLLLAEAEPPGDTAANARFLHTRIGALQSYGAVDAALALVERAGPETPVLFDDWMDLSLLRGTEQTPCRVLTQEPTLSKDYAARVFCLVQTGDWPTAALIYDTSVLIGQLDPVTASQLALFLDPEFGGDGIDLPPPRDMTPLLFRLYEANGTPLPTGSLPREFAAADLRGTTGWRAEIEAAERLARTGALPANRLLGLYTARQPAASGGVWDRVRHLQAFDRAMLSGDNSRISSTLPAVWQDMREAGLGVAFATLYGERLSRLDLPELSDMTYEIGLLSPSYATVANSVESEDRSTRFLAGIARGTADLSLARSATEQAIARAFAEAAPARKYAGPLSEGKLGEVVVDVIIDLSRAASGQSGQIESTLSTLRFVGLEDVARQTALQILLLPPQ